MEQSFGADSQGCVTRVTELRVPDGRERWGVVKRAFVYLVLIPFFAAGVYPFLWVVSTSLKPLGEVYSNQSLVPQAIELANYLQVWRGTGIGLAFSNTVKVVSVSLFFHMTMVTLAGYAFARFPFPGRRFFFALFLASMMVPGAVTLIPSYLLVRSLHIFDTLWALYLPYAGFGMAVGIFLMRTFFEGISKELEEAAKVDGASEFQVFLRVMLPLAKPAAATVVILRLLNYWNEFLWAFLVIQRESLKTLQVKLQEFLIGYPGQWQLMSAALVVSSLPLLILFLLFQRQFVKGLTEGAVKG